MIKIAFDINRLKAVVYNATLKNMNVNMIIHLMTDF